jgi:hypothetical protein
MQITEAIKENSTLHEIGFWGNQIGNLKLQNC